MQHLIIIAIVIAINADPVPSGGADCKSTKDCGLGGICNFDNKTIETGSCVCFPQYGNTNCTYQRSSKTVAAGLQIGLAFICINGVGNFILGLTGHAVGQLLLGLSVYICIIPMACIMCCGAMSGDEKIIVHIKGACGCIICLATLAGFVWTIYDGAMMLNSDYLDASGYNLY